jgi:hypothetical protein
MRAAIPSPAQPRAVIKRTVLAVSLASANP